MVLAPAAFAVVLMLSTSRGIVRKDGDWDMIFVVNVLALVYGLVMLYWWTITPLKDPL